MLDGTTGSFYVIDALGLCGTMILYQTLGVTLNNSPVVVDVSNSDYNITNVQGAKRILTLTGSDPDAYHTTQLTFVIVTLTSAGPLALCDAQGNITRTLMDADLPFSIKGNANTTNNSTSLTVCYSPLEYYLSLDRVT
jgi:hypothetical protein